MRDDDTYLSDILEASERIEAYLAGQPLEAFLQDRMRQDAVLYRLAVIGEAAARLSKALRDTQSSVPWRKLVAMRNILVHDYAGADPRIAWRTGTVHVPELVPVVRAMRQALSGGGTGAANDPAPPAGPDTTADAGPTAP